MEVMETLNGGLYGDLEIDLRDALYRFAWILGDTYNDYKDFKQSLTETLYSFVSPRINKDMESFASKAKKIAFDIEEILDNKNDETDLIKELRQSGMIQYIKIIHNYLTQEISYQI